MTAKPGQDSKPESNDAASNALEREQAVAPKEMPVKQHNPDDQGINPEQKGPAQPSEDGD